MSVVASSWITEAVAQAFERFNAGDVEGVVALCAPDVEFTTFLGRFEGRSYRGPGGIREWFAQIDEAFPSFHVSVGAIREDGDVAIVEITFSAIGAASGVSLSEHLYQRIEFRDRLATSWSWHPTRDTALGSGRTT